MKRHFDDELRHLKEKLLRMGELVERAISGATEALFGRDSAKAQQVLQGDQEINILEIEIDEMGHELMARYQPAAVDLRLITMVLKITNDLERMGDQAVNIAQQVMVFNDQPAEPFGELPKMAEEAVRVMREALTAFMEGDPARAQAILEADDQVDHIHDQIYEEVQKTIEGKPKSVRAGVAKIMISHNLERIADLATNIAEDVIYLKRGIDVRHHIRERRGETPGA